MEYPRRTKEKNEILNNVNLHLSRVNLHLSVVNLHLVKAVWRVKEMMQMQPATKKNYSNHPSRFHRTAKHCNTESCCERYIFHAAFTHQSVVLSSWKQALQGIATRCLSLWSRRRMQPWVNLLSLLDSSKSTLIRNRHHMKAVWKRCERCIFHNNSLIYNIPHSGESVKAFSGIPFLWGVENASFNWEQPAEPCADASWRL